MPSPVPIVLTANPVPGAQRPLDINQFLQTICQYVSAQISQNVSFFIQGAAYPVSDQGIFFNQTTEKFGVWSSAYGKYIAIGDRTVGELVASYLVTDDLPNGLVVLDGRAISAITGLSQQQTTNLETIFGVTASLPNFTFFAALQGLPDSGAFSGIPISPFVPLTSQVQAISFTGSYAQAAEQALQSNVASTVTSATSLQSAVQQIQGVAESLLDALVNYTPSGVMPVWKIFAGFP